MPIKKSKRQWWLIFAVYVLMLAGGLWHRLGMFAQLREIMAAPLLIGLTVWVFLEAVYSFRTSAGNRRVAVFLYWAGFVVVISFLIEWLGVRSGLIFGRYHYGPILQPQIDSVPIAIGFAWLLSVMGAMAISRILLGRFGESNFLFIFTSALILVVFDMFLEAAATEIGYWQWQDGRVPLQNYFAWFFIGGFFVSIAAKLGLLLQQWSGLIVHVFIAQLAYFILVII